MNCKIAIENLDLYATNRIDKENKLSIDLHLKDCKKCNSIYKESLDLESKVVENLPEFNFSELEIDNIVKIAVDSRKSYFFTIKKAILLPIAAVFIFFFLFPFISPKKTDTQNITSVIKEQKTQKVKTIRYFSGKTKKVLKLDSNSSFFVLPNTEIVYRIADEKVYAEITKGKVIFNIEPERYRGVFITAGRLSLKVTGTLFYVDKTTEEVSVMVGSVAAGKDGELSDLINKGISYSVRDGKFNTIPAIKTFIADFISEVLEKNPDIIHAKNYPRPSIKILKDNTESDMENTRILDGVSEFSDENEDGNHIFDLRKKVRPHLLAGNYTEAVKVYNSYLNSGIADTNVSLVMISLSECYIKLKEYDKAETILVKATKIATNEYDKNAALFVGANLALIKKDTTEYIKRLRVLESNDPEGDLSPSILLSLVEIELARNKYPLAIELLIEFTERFKDHSRTVEALYNAATLSMQHLEDNGDACSLFKSITEDYKHSSEYEFSLFWYAKCSFYGGDTTNAIQSFGEYLELFPKGAFSLAAESFLKDSTIK